MPIFRRKPPAEPQPESVPTTDETSILPGPCPSCGGPGFLDHIDLVAQRQVQHCKACGTEWETSFKRDEGPSFFDMEVDGIELPDHSR